MNAGNIFYHDKDGNLKVASNATAENKDALEINLEFIKDQPLARARISNNIKGGIKPKSAAMVLVK